MLVLLQNSVTKIRRYHVGLGEHRKSGQFQGRNTLFGCLPVRPPPPPNQHPKWTQDAQHLAAVTQSVYRLGSSLAEWSRLRAAVKLNGVKYGASWVWHLITDGVSRAIVRISSTEWWSSCVLRPGPEFRGVWGQALRGFTAHRIGEEGLKGTAGCLPQR